MAYTAKKRDCSFYVVFTGGSGLEYPKWFLDFIEKNSYEDEYRRTVLVQNNLQEPYVVHAQTRYWSSLLEENYDAFIRNANGEVMHVNIDVIGKHYVEIAPGLIALKEDVMEYVYFINEYDIFPEWFAHETIGDGVLSIVDDVIITGSAEDEALFNDGCIFFIKNLDGDIRAISYERFNSDYFWKGNATF